MCIKLLAEQMTKSKIVNASNNYQFLTMFTKGKAEAIMQDQDGFALED